MALELQTSDKLRSKDSLLTEYSDLLFLGGQVALSTIIVSMGFINTFENTSIISWTNFIGWLSL